MAPGPSAGEIKLEICQRLVDDWPDLADYLQMPPATRARFARGREPQGIWEWLEARKQLPRLRDALAHIGRDDLVEVFQRYPRQARRTLRRLTRRARLLRRLQLPSLSHAITRAVYNASLTTAMPWTSVLCSSRC